MVTMSDQDGSVIVAATVFVVILGVAVGAAAARGASVSAGAIGAHERLQARAAAEHGLRLALLDLESPSSRDDIVRRRPLDRQLSSAHGSDAGIAPTGTGVSAHARHVASGDDRIDVSVDAHVGFASASARAVVRPRLSTDLVLVTEHRALDPALLGIARVACTLPPGHPGRDARCLDPALGDGAVEGPVHTNEPPPIPQAAGPSQLFTTSMVLPGLRHRSELELPRTVAHVVGELPVTCRFRGPTLLRFDGAGVRVRSPRSVPRDGEPLDATTSIGCMGVDRSTLGEVTIITLPDRAIIEVVRDGDPSCSVHPLGLVAGEDGAMDWMCDAGDVFVWGRYRGARTVLAQDSVQIVWDLEPGDAGAASPPSEGDVLGLVAGDSIVLRRPVSAATWTFRYGRNVAFAGPGIAPFGGFPLDAPTSTAHTWDAPRIVASLAALRGTVTIQNVFRGEPHPGELTIVGSVASRFTPSIAWEHRSATGALLGATGYRLELRYDPRLDRTPPPAMPMIDAGRVRILELDVG
jgi:hypothetical protein